MPPCTRKRSRGSALIATMMVIAMLMAVVLVLSHYQSVARQTYMAEEASLRFREGSRFELRRQILNLPVPGGLKVTATSTNQTPAGTPKLDKLMAQKIFDRLAGLPDLRALDHSAAHELFKLTPTTPDVGLRVFGSNTWSTAITSVPGYAAYAPKGSVSITSVEGWANPTFQDTRKALEAYSGVPAMVAALKDASLAKATYGEAHVIEGTAKVDLGNGSAYKAPQFPLRKYSDGVVTQLLAARDQLKNNAKNSGDKTLSLVSTSTGPAAIIDLFFGGSTGLQQFISLRNANHFWMPMIPSFSPSPPYLYQFAFSVPYPPDNANYTSSEDVVKKIDDLGKQVTAAGKELEAAKKAMDQAQANYNNNNSAANLQLYLDAKAAWNSAVAKVEDLNQQMAAVTGPQTANINAQSASGMKGIPLTRQDDAGLGNEGQTGWNYSVAGKLLGDLIGFLFSFDPKKLADSVSNPDVKLVHFGGKNREYKFVLDENNMTLDATLTVPRGRTLSLASAGTITVAGDLWLQRGSTFYADCNRLNVVPGRGSDPSKFFSPSGRIFLEEGATLICKGDIDCVGSSQWGSVIVGGMPGKIHPITTAIFGRNVHLNSGVFAGCALDDLLEGLGVDNATLKSLSDDLFRPLLSVIGPNASKALGPFWARKPYFSKYATTFQIICPPLPPFGEPGPPIPTPIPLPSKNVLVPIERALSYVFSVSLNLSLGENFYTHSDWWIFGEGVVPMVPQMDPAKVTGAISSFGSAALDALNPENILKSFIESAVKDMVAYVVKEVIQEVVKKVATNVIPYAGLVDMAGSLLTDAADNLLGREGKRDGAGSSLTSALTDSIATSAKNTLNTLSTKFDMALHDQFLREYNGVLVYADDTLTVAGKNATGMFIAQNNLTVDADQCVGTLLSVNKDIKCQSLLFYPYFNQASLYVPKATDSDWFLRALEYKYDTSFDSKTAVDVGPPAIPAQISAQGWAQ